MSQKIIDGHPVISVFLDTRRTNKTKLFPVKLRATFQVIRKGKKAWVQKYYPLKKYCSKSDFKSIQSIPRTTKQKDIKNAMLAAQQKANKILASHTYINIELFDRLYNSAGNFESVASVFTIKIGELDKEGRVGTADLYRAVKNSLPEGLSFYEVTSDWIRKYTKGRNLTTAAIYLRHLRAIYNKAISMRLVNSDLYPFGRGGYVIKKTKSRKIALSEVDKNRLIKIKDPGLRWVIDMWLVSYYCYGLNMTDVCMLRVKDLKDDVLIISRAKTGSELIIPLRGEVKEIIARHGNRTLNPNDYVFPVLQEGLTARQIKNRVKDFTKAVNAGLKKVREKLELNIKLTTYTARHTSAMMALRKGASLELIQEMLGHGSKLTTQDYMSGFDLDTKRAISDKL